MQSKKKVFGKILGGTYSTAELEELIKGEISMLESIR
jgi:hypothetical protein